MASKLALLTSANAVTDAIAECDRMGRDAFLRKYGYRYSRKYPLRVGSKTYDSKAIVGVAFGKQHGTPLRSADFSGGVATVIPVLKRMGFFAREAPHPIEVLIPRRTYARKELLESYGGQLQSGIWTPKEFPVVFLFTGESGQSYGYEDGWTPSGVFKYTGEGQAGDMEFSGGNKAVRDHRQNGRDLFLFEDLGKGKGVRFVGLFECASWEERGGKDKQGVTRKIIVFDLVPVGTAAASDEDVDPPGSSTRSLEELRAAAYAASSPTKPNAKTADVKRIWYERSKKVRDYVLARANGTCEACDAQAPFRRRDGTLYLEPHHTTRLADDGPDHPSCVGAICPTCHRRIHSGDDGVVWNKRLQERLKCKEPDK